MRQRASIVLSGDADLHFFYRSHRLVLVFELLIDDSVYFDHQCLVVSYGADRVGLFGVGADDESDLSFLQ